MKLFEHPDFKDAISASESHFANTGLTAQLIEKDYYVTEVLRLVALQYPNRVIFKGGTSLSKGWKLINRFSEDIDLFLNRDEFDPPLGNKGVDRTLKLIEQSILNQNLNLIKLTNLSTWSRGSSRNSYFEYPTNFSGNIAIPNRVLLEMGIRSGSYPVEKIKLSSYLAEFLQNTDHSLGAEDETSFEMSLLHFCRTFVEKLFTIHSKVEEYKNKSSSIQNSARHYYDIFCLAQQPAVKMMLESSDYQKIKEDCDKISRMYFSGSYYEPDNLSFSNSDALFPSTDLRIVIATEYDKQCSTLCYETYPTWEEVELCFQELKELL